VHRTRTAALYVVPAIVITFAWLRIERPHSGIAKAEAVALIALAPALVRGWWRAAAIAGSALLVAWIALEATIAHPLQLLSRLWDGSITFYDVTLPFNPGDHPHNHGAVLVALFVFCLAAGLALASRRALLASAVVVVGAGWPGTLLRGGDQLLLGVLVLASVLVILAALRPRPAQTLLAPTLAGGAVVACALAFSTMPAVARGELLHWEGWDLYTKQGGAVDVAYVWNSNYKGLNWPRRPTTVLRITAPARPLYWRATTLDAYVDGSSWFEDLSPRIVPRRAGRDDLSDDPLLPRRARDPHRWVEQSVAVTNLHDRHLVGADTPVAYEARGLGGVAYAKGGTALVNHGSDQGRSYRVWSYVPRPTPAQLVKSKPLYPRSIAKSGDFLSVDRGVSVPPFGAPGREAYVADLISSRESAYFRLYQQARRVVGKARDPYAAVVGLESWFRDGGQFTYDEHPPAVPGIPPLVAFVTKTRRGYCQHFAGAMALMLRYLGIPARVAAGFTSGSYDGKSGVWTVTDRDAHTWVEVWFRGYGWLPFDPTPGRGGIGAPYTASSKTFDANGAAAALGPVGGALESLLETRLNTLLGGGRGERARSVPLPQTGSHHRGLKIVGILLLLLGGLAAAIYLGKLALRRARYLGRDARGIAAACRRELVGFLVDQRLDVGPSATLHELGKAVDDEFRVAADAFVAAAASARFGAPSAAGPAAKEARRELRELERVLRRRLTRLERFLGALSIRSLRTV
jgi:transglutaminase-like putative cysteine protease